MTSIKVYPTKAGGMTTREELAAQLGRDADSGDFGFGAAVEPMRQAAAELRKRCGGCEAFEIVPDIGAGWICERNHPVPEDGSGFCHAWEPKS